MVFSLELSFSCSFFLIKLDNINSKSKKFQELFSSFFSSSFSSSTFSSSSSSSFGGISSNIFVIFFSFFLIFLSSYFFGSKNIFIIYLIPLHLIKIFSLLVAFLIYSTNFFVSKFLNKFISFSSFELFIK